MNELVLYHFVQPYFCLVVFKIYFIFGGRGHSLWDVSLLARDWTQALSSESWVLTTGPPGNSPVLRVWLWCADIAVSVYAAFVFCYTWCTVLPASLWVLCAGHSRVKDQGDSSVMFSSYPRAACLYFGGGMRQWPRPAHFFKDTFPHYTVDTNTCPQGLSLLYLKARLS